MTKTLPARNRASCARIALVTLLAWLDFAAATSGQADDDFLRGKTLTFMVPTSPGGGYDSYSRLVARHIGAFLRGQPTVVVQNMPGAAGMRAANHLFHIAPRDGTVIAMLDQAVILDSVLATPGLTADPTQFSWIGRVTSNSAVLYAWHAARVKAIEDVFQHELLVSTSGAASRLNWTVLNNLLGTKFKIITGYKGANDSRLAMIRGEVDALSQPWSMLKQENEQHLKNRQINLLLQTGLDRNPELASVPRMIDLARNDDDRALLALFSSPSVLGRSVAAPPGLPQDRVAALRSAFAAAMASPGLLADAAKLKLDLDPLDGSRLQAELTRGSVVSTPLRERARRAVEGR